MAKANISGHLVTIEQGQVSCLTAPPFADIARQFYLNPPSYISNAANWALEKLIESMGGEILKYDQFADLQPQR